MAARKLAKQRVGCLAVEIVQPCAFSPFRASTTLISTHSLYIPIARILSVLYALNKCLYN
jgi:hypothetical protein